MAEVSRSSRFGAVIRVTSGNFIEMYDFFLFGFYANAISKAFFPAANEVAALMLTFASFGAGFLMRPVGAVVLGAYVDRVGRRRGLLLMLSDFYDDEAATLTELKRAARRGHEAAVLQVMSRPEIEFPYSGGTEFEDLESPARRIVDAAAIGREYRARVAAFLERWRTDARTAGLDYALLTTDRAPDEALRGYLIRRGAGRDVTPLVGTPTGQSGSAN